MQKGLVSILTPCYNTGSIVHRLFDSILAQDYPSIEMYAINDGSSDNTEKIIKSYIPRFESKGYRLTYIYQGNSGQSVAINNALKLVNGEFLMWPDSDDYYAEANSISKMVKTLSLLPHDYAVVRDLPIFVSEVDGKELSRMMISPTLSAANQFMNCLNSQNFIWPPVNYVIRMELFDEVCPSREIYVEKNAGQNWQILLPLLYTYKCHTINEYLCHVLVRKSSHSRGLFMGFSKTLEKEAIYERTILETIDRIPQLTQEEKTYYSVIVRKKYAIDNMNLCIYYKNPQKALYYADNYNNLSPDKLDKYTVLMCKYCKAPIFYAVLRLLRKLFYK